MKKYKAAAMLMLIHGGCMEIGGVLCLIPALILGAERFDIQQYFSFKLPYFQDDLSMMLIMGALYGAMRIIGAVGLLKNRGAVAHSHIILGLIGLPLFRKNIAQRRVKSKGEPFDHAINLTDRAKFLLGINTGIDILRGQPFGEPADIRHIVILLNVLTRACDGNCVQEFEVVHIHHLNKCVGSSLLIWQLRPLVEDALGFLQQDLQVGDTHFCKGIITPLGDEVDLVLNVVHAVVNWGS